MPPLEPLNSPESDNDLGALYQEDRTEAEIQDTLSRWGDVAAEQQPAPATEATNDDEEDEGITVGGVVSETGRFIRDIPLQTIGAARDAAQGLLDTGRGVADVLQSIGVPDAVIQLTNEKGEFDLDIMGRDMAEDKGGFELELPDIPEGASAASHPYRKIVQFLIPFSRVSAGMQATKVGASLMGTKAGAAAVDIAAGAATDLVFWEKQEAKLADLIESTRGTEFDLSNPVTEFLATDEEDSIVVDKIKTALEGMGLAAFIHTLMGGMRAIKGWRQNKAATKAATKAAKTAAEEAELATKVATQADEQLKAALGPPDMPAVSFEMVDPADVAKAANDPLGRYTALYAIDDESAAAIAKQTGKAAEISKAAKSLDDLTNKWNQAGITSSVSERNGIITLNKVEVPKAAQKTGKGTAYMDDLIAYADSTGQKITLTPSTDFGATSVKRLEGFYKRFGFVKNAGKNKDFTISESMYRESKPLDLTIPKNAIGRPIINFNTIGGSEDVDNVLKLMSRQFKQTAKKARGAVATNEETQAIAKELGITDLMQIEAGRFNRSEILALKDVYTQSGTKLLEVAELATQAPTDANLFAFRKMLAVHEDLLGRFVGAKAEAGRTLQALAIKSDSGSKERLQAIGDVLESMGGTDVALAMAKKISSLKDASPDAMADFVKRGAGAKTLDAVTEAWVLGLVSGPTSQARNILSNLAFMYENAMERGVAARLPGSTVEKGEATAFLFGTMQSLRQGFINAGKAFHHNTSGFGIGKVDLPFRHAISSEAFGLDSHGMAGRLSDFIGGYYRIFGRGLNAGDEFFKTLNYNGELWAQALRKAKHEGLTDEGFYKSVAQMAMNPDEAMRVAGRTAAQRATFTTKLGETGKHYQKMVGSMPALRFLTPFIRTPGNIFKEGFLRSPFALAMPKSFWAEIKKGGPAKDLALAKVATGSTVMALFSDLSSRGIVTGRGPLDPTERQRLRETGWAPYSIKVEDTWYNYRSIEPIGMVLGLSADITELLHQHTQLEGSDDPKEQEKANKLAGAAIAAIGNSVTSATFVRGVSEFFEMMANPQMKADHWMRNYASTVVPRMFKSIERQVDPALRETYNMADKIADQMPWYGSKFLHPLRDLYGKPIELSGAWGPDWISPVYTSKEDASPVSRAIVDIDINIKKPGRTTSFAIPGEGSAIVSLKNFPAVYDRYQVLAGNELKHPAHELGFEALANKMVTGKHDLSAIWEPLSDTDITGVADKGEFLKGLANEYRELARLQLMEEAQQALFKDPKDHTELDLQLIELRADIKKRIDFQREANMKALGGF